MKICVIQSGSNLISLYYNIYRVSKTSLSRSMQGLRNRLGSFEIPTIQIPSSINVSFPSEWNIQPNWNLKVRISKFSRKWIYGCRTVLELLNFFAHW